MDAYEFRIALHSLGLRQNRLAAALGVDFNTVSRWAVGTVAVPRYAVAYLAALSWSGKTGKDLAEMIDPAKEPMSLVDPRNPLFFSTFGGSG